MNLLYEKDVYTDMGRLDEAWQTSVSFALIPKKCEVPEDWILEKLELLPEQYEQDHFALLTSGSTGLPKLVVGSRRRAEELVTVLHMVQDSDPVEMTVVALPLSYCYAFVNKYVWSRKFDRRLVATEGFSNPGRLKQALRETRAGMLCLVGVQVPLLHRYFEKEEFDGIIRVHFAGGRFPQENLSFLRERFPNAQIFNNYGCTEAMPRLTIRSVEATDKAMNIGHALPGITIITDAEDRLYFKSPFGAVAFVDDNGYHEVTSNTRVPSGDLAQQNSDGSWSLLGRENDLFKRYGEKISLPRLFATVNNHWPGQIAFYRETDKNGEEGHVLIIAPKAKEEQVRMILKAFRKHHPRAHWPLRVESIEALPTLRNGKMDYVALRTLSQKVVHWQQMV